jgi:hypothetical protein
MAGREMLPSEVGVGLPKVSQRDSVLDLNGILCRSRTVKLASCIKGYQELLRGDTSHGYRGMMQVITVGGPILEMSALRREEKHGGRVKKGLHGPKYVGLAQIRVCGPVRLAVGRTI